MTISLIKILTPFLLTAVWGYLSRSVHSRLLVGAGLYLASFAGFSSNFTPYYREIHQFLQLLLITVFLSHAIRTGLVSKINRVFLALFSLIVISLIYAPFDSDAKAQLLNYCIIVGVCNYLITSIKQPEDFRIILKYISIIAIFLSFIGVFEFLQNPGLRVEGTFSNPNYYGFFVGIGFCATATILKGRKKFFFLVLLLSAIFLSGSRSCLAFPLIYFLYQSYKLQHFWKRFFIILLIMGFVFLTISSGITRFTAEDASAGSDAERRIFTTIGLKMANDYPFTGVGWGRFISEFGNYSTHAERILTSSGVVDLSEQYRRVTHNDYLRILAELGWISFVLSLALSIHLFLITLKNKLCSDYNILPIFVGIIIFSMTHNNINNALFWFLFLLPLTFNGFCSHKK